MTASPASLLRRWWAYVVPTHLEVWTFFLGSVIPLLILAGFRLFIATTMVETMRGVDWWRVPVGELEFWALWSFWWWVGYKLIGRFARRTYRALFHVVSLIVAIFSLLDLAYFQTSGSRTDWEMLLYGFADLPRVWPVVSSEMTPMRWLMVAATTGVLVFPLFRRWKDPRPAWITSVLWLIFVGTAVEDQLEGRPRAVERLRSLQPGFCELLFWDGLSRWDDRTLPPAPEDLIPLAVQPQPDVKRPNIVVVVLESVGAMSTTAYNPNLQTTPNLLRLAEAGMRVERMFSVVPHTSKSLVTMMCGDWPYLHADIKEARGGGLPGRCLPELLREAGYRTAFLQAAREDFEDRVDLVHGMGFQTFYPKAVLESDKFEKSNYFGLDDFSMVDPGLAWSTKTTDQPFFATYLTLASHHAYTLPKGAEPQTWRGYTGRRSEYLAAVHYVDSFLGELINRYEQAGLMENTVFIVVGDHGEAFGEHGRNQHDLVIWDEGLRIPFVMYGPNVLPSTEVIGGQHQQIDLMPSVLELAKLDVVGGKTRGVSLFAPPSDRTLFHSCWRSYRCLAMRQGYTKFIDHYREKPPQLFDLKADPTERHDRSAKIGADEIASRRKEMRDWRARLLGRFQALHAAWKERVQVEDTGAPAQMTWDGRIEGLSCTTEQKEVFPGEAVWVDCAWRVKEPVSQAVRIVGRVEAGPEAEEDTWVPGRGELPIWEWTPGRVVHDSFRAHVPAKAQPGPAKLSMTWRSYSGRPLNEADQDWQIADLTVLPRPNGPFTGESDVLGDDVELKP